MTLPRGLLAQTEARVVSTSTARSSAAASTSAKSFAANADNITTGTINADQLPLATSSTPGIVQPDDITISVDVNGVISATYVFPSYTVSHLPTGTAFLRVFATDSTQTLTAGIGTPVVGGGANIVPVYTPDGTTWIIG